MTGATVKLITLKDEMYASELHQERELQVEIPHQCAEFDQTHRFEYGGVNIHNYCISIGYTNENQWDNTCEQCRYIQRE